MRAAKLEDELKSVREALVGLENENHSLRITLDLIVSEKSLLLQRLAESISAIDDGRSRIEQMTRALAAAQIERKNLIDAIAAGHENLELIRSTLVAKERQIQQLEQSRWTPIRDHSETMLADTVTF